MDIRPINSVMAGMEVTVSKTDITYNGWTGCGYIVINPLTGSGGYMISGGMNGAMIILAVAVSMLIIFGIVAIAAFLLGGSAFIGVIGAVLVGLGIGLSFSQILPQKVRDVTKLFFKQLSLKFFMPVLFTLEMPVAAMVAFIAWIVLTLVDYFAVFHDRRQEIGHAKYAYATYEFGELT